MSADLPDTALELRSLVTSGGTLELSLHEVPVPTPGANEVVVRVEASPINPSELGLLIAGPAATGHGDHENDHDDDGQDQQHAHVPKVPKQVLAGPSGNVVV